MQSGRQQIGPYRVINLIGRGGMGDVYLAEDPRIQRQVAIKVMQIDASPSANAPKRTSRLQREAQAIAQLNHPNIVRLYSYDEETSGGVISPYMVMEYYREGSFAEWLRQRSEPPSLQDVAHFIRQAADALQYAHTNGVLHQDVKPANFLIRTNKDAPNRPDIFLTDFGVARLMNADVSTLMTAPMVTFTYMAPEQLEGSAQALPATDQYALATMAYELITGRPPFQGPPSVVMRQHLNDQPQPPSLLNPRLPRAIDNVILRALSKRPEDRYSSISEFARAFQQAVQRQSGGVQPSVPGQTIAPPPPPPGPAKVYAPPPPPAYPGGNVPQPQPRPVYPGINVPAPRPSQVYTPQPLPPVTTNDKKRNRGLIAVVSVIVLVAVVLLLVVYAISANHPKTNPTITATPDTQATATAVASNYPFSNTLVLDDSLSGNTSHNWFVGSNSSGTAACGFVSGGYQVSVSSSFFLCSAQNTNFSNFTYEVQMQIIRGDCGGIMFRANPQAVTAYYFPVCSNGQYGFFRFAGCSTCVQTLTSGSIPNFAGSQLNRIAVVANGSRLDLYVNGQRIGGTTDNHYSSGQIGVGMSVSSAQTQVVFSNAKVWTL